MDLQALHDAVDAFFKEEEWNYEYVNERLLRFGMKGENLDVDAHMVLDEEDRELVMYSEFPVKVPPEKRGVIAELLTRINYVLRHGNFEMSFDEGDLYFRTGLDAADAEVTPTLVRNVVFRNFWMMDRYVPTIMSVLYGGISPKVVLEPSETMS
ncbi:YbjN domain-containing protein [Alicyclobacillus sp. SO9]|uniref:YbjN domain-containing protein n=1 Tax=Alicyclobacillus sp. SO9 TaxID=2665646 RepID=UPI0018E8F402|nr:YbjN domain-containing protein [Alicyclobacillus sp. SO9]QQE80454.1 YbjN domain-containing protein [Alicyclobacillus sp. SO9]